MKKYLLWATLWMVTVAGYAQQPTGTVIYQRVSQLHFQINNGELASRLPQTITDKYELLFGNNQSLWKHVDEEQAVDDNEYGGGIQIGFRTVGQNDIVFCDFGLGTQVAQKEIFDKKYIVTDSIGKLKWKPTGETQTILNHICQKAISQKIVSRMDMNIDNGKVDKKEVSDTLDITAWFTMDIPIAAGPEFPGQLPGLILKLEMKNGSIVYTAIKISGNAVLSDIKAPVKGKKVTPEGFKAAQHRLMDEMQKNNRYEGPGRKVIIRG